MFGSKAAMGLGGQCAGVGLQLIGFSAVGTGNAPAPSSIGGLGMLWGPGGAVLLLVALPFLRRYKIDRKHHAHVIASIAARQALPKAA